MSPFWRAFFGAILGKLAVNLLLGLCLALGFGGPNEWVAFMISGMPAFITPGIARLGLFLIASGGLFLEWRRPVQDAIAQWPRKRAAYTVFVLLCCLPFVVGAFYVTAHSVAINPDRHLTSDQKEAMYRELSKIPKEQMSPIVVASVDDPEATTYAIEFIYFFRYYAIPVVEIWADPPR
jgi:hypothetical protein